MEDALQIPCLPKKRTICHERFSSLVSGYLSAVLFDWSALQYSNSLFFCSFFSGAFSMIPLPAFVRASRCKSGAKPPHMASPGFPLLSRSPSAEIICSTTSGRIVTKGKRTSKTTGNAKPETRDERRIREYHLHHYSQKSCSSPLAMITVTDEPHPGSIMVSSYSIFLYSFSFKA